MPQFLARVNCPSCGTVFQAPVDQILDVRMNPDIKNRLLNGAVNVAVCPSCGSGGALNIPFIYHDPENEIALLYLPVETGRTEVERQQFAGRLTRQLMDSLAPEERKGYLLQPETFINMDTLIRRVLEIDGVTDEDLEYSNRQQEFLGELMQAEPEKWPEMMQENDVLIDEGFFSMLDYALHLTASMGGEDNEGFKRIQDLQTYLVENHTLGQSLSKRAEVIGPFMENPTRDTLLTAIINAPDDDTIQGLVQMGIQLLDYAFFQQLLAQIESAEGSEQDRLKVLRRKILGFRDELAKASEAAATKRLDLLRNLLDSEDPLKMARSHFSELDELFSMVLSYEIQQAQAAHNHEYLEKLKELAKLLQQIAEESMPPEVLFMRRLLMMPDDEKLKALLEHNKQSLVPEFFDMLDAMLAMSEERGEKDSVERIKHIKTIAQEYAPAQPSAPQQTAPSASELLSRKPQQPSASENRTESGLIIAKR